MFQVLDDKGSCVGIYKDGELHFSNIPKNLDKTWNYVDFLKGMEVEYASIYAQGNGLDDCCPQSFKGDWDSINKKLRALINSFIISKVSLKENCFFDLAPQRFLKEYCEAKNRICDHVFETYQKPQEYTFFREFSELISDISRRELKIDRDLLSGRIYNPQAKKLWEKINDGQTHIKYNMFSSVTGRLTVTDRSFPILTLNSKMRDIIKPTNDWFVSFDLNAAEMRVALALAGENQPSGDLHEYVRREVFGEDYTRAQAKNISTQWLYDAKNEDTIKHDIKLSNFYNKQKLFSDFWKNDQVITPFNRKIDSDAHHVISYLCQSTLIDLFHRQLIKIFLKLQNKSSFISFMVHDQVILDLKDSEKNLLPDLVRELSDTQFGTFPVKVEIGSNFGDMKKVNLKV